MINIAIFSSLGDTKFQPIEKRVTWKIKWLTHYHDHFNIKATMSWLQVPLGLCQTQDIAPSPIAKHLEVRITGLSNMSLKNRVPCHSTHWHVKKALVLKTVNAQHRSKFADLHLQYWRPIIRDCFLRGLIDWLVIYCFTSRSRIFHLYGDVTTAGEGLKI
jgi:hypothetical protein